MRLIYSHLRRVQSSQYPPSAQPEFLELKFPLRPYAGATPVRMDKVKVDSPIPGMKFPKGSRLERGSSPTPTVGGAGAGKAGAEPVSTLALAKRVAADQLGM